ncbi:MAG: GDP-mannose 4,6-dehydratase [Hyphomicrobiales bacterium]|nr:GDP-mannose 4,6-dehydratase [Hyphomicrobiales bacterium]
MRFFVTGSAGFIGFHLCRRLLADGHLVDGFDAMTPYYDPELKRRRLRILERTNGFRNTIGHLEDMTALEAAYRAAAPDVVVHLAAQAGVRYSLENPRAYVDSNFVGTFNLLECARAAPPKHVLLASTSSVYGVSRDTPFYETNATDRPITIYAATKKATEAMAHAQAHLWRTPTTAFRFFTVYGPWGRPDMAPLKFLQAIEAGGTIDVYNNGDMLRDFTYIDDLVEGIVRLIDRPPGEAPACEGDTLSPDAPFRIVNIGRGAPVQLMDFIAELERAAGKTAKKNFLPMQKGDVPVTFANCDLLERLTGYRPSTGIDKGVAALVAWYRGAGD